MTETDGPPIQRELFEHVPIVQTPVVEPCKRPDVPPLTHCPACGDHWTVRTSKRDKDEWMVTQYMDCRCENTRKRRVSSNYIYPRHSED